MGYTTEEALAGAMIQSYYQERNIDKILELVTDDVQWIGTEKDDSAFGKEELRALLQKDAAFFPQAMEAMLEKIEIRKQSDTISSVIIIGSQELPTDVGGEFQIRITGLCILQEDGTYLMDNLHASVPNSEIEKHSLEYELNETRQKEQILMSGIPGGIAIYRLKKDGRVATEYVSESLAKMCGYGTEEYLEYLRNDCMVNLVPEDVPGVLESVKKSLQRHEPISALYHIYTKKRKPILVRLDANVIQKKQVKEDEIAILYAVHTLVYGDAMVRIQEQKHYRDLMNILQIAYWEWSVDSGYYTSEKYSEYAISDEPNENIWDTPKCLKYIHPDDTALYEEYVKKDDNDSERVSAVLRVRMKDGSYQWTEMFAFAELDDNGRLNRIISVMRGVDKKWLEQKKQLEFALEDAKKANRAKMDFLSRVSHDMRTPLNGILGITTLLQEYVRDHKVLDDLAQLEQSGKYLLNLIEDTLDVSKIESGKLELNPIVCDGRVIFNNVISLVSPNLRERNIKLEVHTENIPFTILYMDVGRVQQIVMNIIGNAIKFTPDGGTIHFTMTNLGVENGIITDQIVIEDNGMGISEEFLPHLFEPFTQERNTITSSSKGTGLGMAITKQIIDMMGGTVNVESEVGKGTRFTIVLPMQIATDEQVANWKKEQGNGGTTAVLKGCHILLCEDHPLNAKIAIRLLENKGVKVDHVVDGTLGVEQFKNSRPGYYDAILMDIRMPVMNGLDAARAIRALERTDAEEIPIIAITANALSSDLRETEEAGMNAHLSKPLEVNKLYTVLEELIKRRSIYIKPKVLIVDDIEMNRIVIREAIRQSFDVLEAPNGIEALLILEQEKGIIAVITDIQMPEMDGINLIRKIRENNEYRRIAIIANTQYGKPEQEDELIELGANDFVYKPTSPKVIELRLHNVLK